MVTSCPVAIYSSSGFRYLPTSTHEVKDLISAYRPIEEAAPDSCDSFAGRTPRAPQFTERLPQGQLARAGDRDEYFPVFFVEPLEGNEKALGFDLASDPVRNEALWRSVATGSLVATGRVSLVQGTGGQDGLLVFRPVYRGGVTPSNARERRELLTGGDGAGTGAAGREDDAEAFGRGAGQCANRSAGGDRDPGVDRARRWYDCGWKRRAISRCCRTCRRSSDRIGSLRRRWSGSAVLRAWSAAGIDIT